MDALCNQACWFAVDGKLYFGQLPLVEIDGLNLVQHNATVRYIAEKGKLIPDDPKDRFRFGIVYDLTVFVCNFGIHYVYEQPFYHFQRTRQI